MSVYLRILEQNAIIFPFKFKFIRHEKKPDSNQSHKDMKWKQETFSLCYAQHPPRLEKSVTRHSRTGRFQILELWSKSLGRFHTKHIPFQTDPFFPIWE